MSMIKEYDKKFSVIENKLKLTEKQLETAQQKNSDLLKQLKQMKSSEKHEHNHDNSPSKSDTETQTQYQCQAWAGRSVGIFVAEDRAVGRQGSRRAASAVLRWRVGIW